MKKVMTVLVALMFAFSMALTGLALADGPMDKGMAPMSDKAKDGQEVSSDAKDKSHEAKMDKKEKKSKKGKKGKKSKKSKKKS